MEKINFTKEDYLERELPYEFLNNLQGSEKQQALASMRDAAKRMGIPAKSFNAIYKAYCEEHGEQQKEQQARSGAGNETAFECELLCDEYGNARELFCGQYVCNEAGVTLNGKTVCVHPILPILRYINAEDDSQRLVIAFRKAGSPWKQITIPKANIANINALIQYSEKGIVVNAENAKALSSYLLNIENLNYEQIPESYSVGHLGWIMQDKFAPYYEGISYEGEQSFQAIYKNIKQCGDYDSWVLAMQKIREYGMMGKLALAASFAAPLVGLLSKLCFYVHIYGDSGCGKSLALKAAASVWGYPLEDGHFFTTYNTTDSALTIRAAFFNSLPLCIDELQVKASELKHDGMIYKLTEGIDRARATAKGGLQRVGAWKLCILSTGESPIVSDSSNAGAMNRTIEYNAVKRIYSDCDEIGQALENNYGFAGKTFIEFLQNPEGKGYASETFRKYYTLLRNEKATDKQAISAALLLTADEIATKLIFADGNQLTIEEMKQITAKDSDIDINNRALIYLSGRVAANVNKFVVKKQFHEEAFDETPKAEIWGRMDEGEVFIILPIFQKEMESGSYNPKLFLKWAQRKGMLLTDGKRKTKNCRIEGNPIPCVCIKRSALFQDDLKDEA